MRDRYPEEKGKLQINGHQMEWVMRRSKGESFFGVRGGRIFKLLIKKDGEVTLEYERGYSKKPESEDEETSLCLSHLIEKYGRIKKKEKKE